MNYIKSMTRLKFFKTSRILMLSVVLLSLLLSLSGCGTKQTVDTAINEIDRTKAAIAGESASWRDELPALLDKLKGIESQSAGDLKGVLADTTNQVQDLVTQTIELSDEKAQNLVAQAGVEFRCNTEFVGAYVKQGVIDQLQYLIDNLQFWKEHKQHLDKKPNHAVCWINPSVLSLYPIGNAWHSEENIVSVFGYNFWPDALPTLALMDANAQKIHDVKITPTYITHYQMNLDFSNEDFANVQPGATVAFYWPDQGLPTNINLVANPPATLKITNATFETPRNPPIATIDAVSLVVTIKNGGGVRSGNFVVTWKPDPQHNDVFSINSTPLNPGESKDYYFPSYLYQVSGPAIYSTVSISTGDDTQTYPLAVADASPPTPVPIASARCPVPIDTIGPLTPPVGTTLFLSDNDVIEISYEHNLPPNQISIILKSAPQVTWWKGLQLQDQNFNVLGTVETQDDRHGPVSMTVLLQTGDQRALIFWKAKGFPVFGAHHQYHCAGDLTQLPGYTVTFTWLRD